MEFLTTTSLNSYTTSEGTWKYIETQGYLYKSYYSFTGGDSSTITIGSSSNSWNTMYTIAYRGNGNIIVNCVDRYSLGKTTAFESTRVVYYDYNPFVFADGYTYSKMSSGYSSYSTINAPCSVTYATSTDDLNRAYNTLSFVSSTESTSQTTQSYSNLSSYWNVTSEGHSFLTYLSKTTIDEFMMSREVFTMTSSITSSSWSVGVSSRKADYSTESSTETTLSTLINSRATISTSNVYKYGTSLDFNSGVMLVKLTNNTYMVYSNYSLIESSVSSSTIPVELETVTSSSSELYVESYTESYIPDYNEGLKITYVEQTSYQEEYYTTYWNYSSSLITTSTHYTWQELESTSYVETIKITPIATATTGLYVDKPYLERQFSNYDNFIGPRIQQSVSTIVEDMFEGLEFNNHKVQYDTDPIELDYVSTYSVTIEE